MLYDSSQFKLLEAGIKLSWMQQQISTQNIANSETPGYKSKSLSFESVLKDAKDSADTSEVERIDAKINTSDTTSTRADGNNVDSEKESLELYKAYAQYSMLLEKVHSEFNKYDFVLNANM
jgi:flagellar basal-body rod protein FlgB